MSRAESLARLALAYGRHQIARRVRLRRRGGRGAERLLETYAPDHLVPVTPAERELMPAMSRCINCGLCALAAGRLGRAHIPDLASSYLRPLQLLSDVGGDLEGEQADLDRAAAACPVGVPIPEVAAMIRRLAAGN